MVKVSVVVPVCNVEKYLRQCLDSIAAQTLKDIEVIIVNDGSTDSSGAICDEYAAKDSRFRVIHKVNTGYGNSMNVGFDAAQGEYIGIVESDDYADDDMFENLYNAAVRHDAEVVKSNFFFYYSVGKEISRFAPNIERRFCGKVFSPADDLTKEEMIPFWNAKNCIWSAIYKKEFIRRHNIRFNETPGASFQDTSFSFKVWTLAKRVFCVYAAYLHYRQDNASSSVNNPGKVYCICDEYEVMEKFLSGQVGKQHLYAVMNRVRFDAYMWNMGRIADRFVGEFAERMAQEFSRAKENNQLDMTLFEPWKHDQLDAVMADPQRFADNLIEERSRQTPPADVQVGDESELSDQGMIAGRRFGLLRGVVHKYRTALSVLRHEGLRGLIRLVMAKLR